MTPRIAMLAAALTAGFATGCVTPSHHGGPAGDPGTVFVLVRHAEKATDDPRDPTLSDAGATRAQRLAAALSETRLVAAYATEYRRTRLTAAPSAMAHHLDVRIYDASQPAPEFARRLREAHPAGTASTETVLVVGHSNTIPALAAALCACEVAPMREDEFDRRIMIGIAADGSARMEVRRD